MTTETPTRIHPDLTDDLVDALHRDHVEAIRDWADDSFANRDEIAGLDRYQLAAGAQRLYPGSLGVDGLVGFLLDDTAAVTAEDLAARYPNPDSPVLAAILAADDHAEDILNWWDGARTTCHTCRTWATEEHRDSAEHKRAIGVHPDAPLGGEKFTLQEVRRG